MASTTGDKGNHPAPAIRRRSCISFRFCDIDGWTRVPWSPMADFHSGRFSTSSHIFARKISHSRLFFPHGINCTYCTMQQDDICRGGNAFADKQNKSTLSWLLEIPKHFCPLSRQPRSKVGPFLHEIDLDSKHQVAREDAATGNLAAPGAMEHQQPHKGSAHRAHHPPIQPDIRPGFCMVEAGSKHEEKHARTPSPDACLQPWNRPPLPALQVSPFPASAPATTGCTVWLHASCIVHI